MRKITILTGPLEGHGGEEAVIADFIELLSDKFTFDIILSENLGNTDWLKDISGLIDEEYVNNVAGTFRKLDFIIKNLSKSKSDIVICLTPKTTLLARVTKTLFLKKYKIVSWLHFAITSKFGNKTANLLKYADFHLAINSGIQNELVSIGIPSENILLAYNPISKQERTIPKSSGKKKFIYMARIQYGGEKNLSELIKAIYLLTNKEKWVLEIYGADDSLNERESNKCKQLIHQLGLEANVVWHGFKKNVWSQISEADCLILTSTSEGFGMVLCEAISYGVPVISSNCPSGPADIVNDQNGYLYQVGHEEELASYLNNFIFNKINFSAHTVKNSIRKMYSDEYKKRIECFLKQRL